MERGQYGARSCTPYHFPAERARQVVWASPPLQSWHAQCSLPMLGYLCRPPQALLEVTSSRPSLSQGHELQPVAVAITVSADRLHPPPTARPTAHTRTCTSPQPFPNFSRPYCSVPTRITNPPHLTQYAHPDCTILAPPWFKDRPTTFRPTHSRGNPFLSPFLLPNLS